jgi:hypothetical protein
MSANKKDGLPNHVKVDHYGGLDKNVMAGINTKIQNDPGAHPTLKASAQAYANGTSVHMGSGQEKHVAHELTHVVQQQGGRS